MYSSLCVSKCSQRFSHYLRQGLFRKHFSFDIVFVNLYPICCKHEHFVRWLFLLSLFLVQWFSFAVNFFSAMIIAAVNVFSAMIFFCCQCCLVQYYFWYEDVFSTMIFFAVNVFSAMIIAAANVFSAMPIFFCCQRMHIFMTMNYEHSASFSVLSLSHTDCFRI